MKKWLLISIVIVSSCSPKIVSHVNTKAKFSQFETYRLVTAKSESDVISSANTQVVDLIKDQVKDQMSIRGYELSNISPDLTLRYEITSNTRVDINNTQVSPLYPQVPVNSRTIYESALLLELIDSKNKLVWQGSYDLKQEKKEKRIEQSIKRAVGYIFTTYPYRALSSKQDPALKTFDKKKK